MSGLLDCSIKAQKDRAEAAKRIASDPSQSIAVANDLNKLNAMCQNVQIPNFQKGGSVSVPQSTGPHAVYNGSSPPVKSLNKPLEPAEPLDKSRMPEKPPPPPKEEFASFPSNSPSTPVTTIMDTIPLKPAHPLE